MKAILLAAGYGTRLRPITNNIPKCLVPIKGRALLDYWLKILDNTHIDEIIINTHYLHEKVVHFISNHPMQKKVTLVHEPTLLGTGGTLRHLSPLVGNAPFFVAHADNLTQFSLNDFIHFHHNNPPKIMISMMTFTTDTPQHCGIVETCNHGVVRAFHEKVSHPPSCLANAAVFIMEPEIMHFIKTIDKNHVDISLDVLPYYIDRIRTFHNNTYHRDIGSLDSLKIAEREYVWT